MGKFIVVLLWDSLAMFPIKLDISPGQYMEPAATDMKGIQLLFSQSRSIKTDEYNSFLRRVVGMEEAL